MFAPLTMVYHRMLHHQVLSPYIVSNEDSVSRTFLCAKRHQKLPEATWEGGSEPKKATCKEFRIFLFSMSSKMARFQSILSLLAAFILCTGNLF